MKDNKIEKILNKTGLLYLLRESEATIMLNWTSNSLRKGELIRKKEKVIILSKKENRS